MRLQMAQYFLIFALVSTVTACGSSGGSDDDDGSPDNYESSYIRFSSPTESDSYTTREATVSTSGYAETPASADCRNLPAGYYQIDDFAPGYRVSLYNHSNGRSVAPVVYLQCTFDTAVVSWYSYDVPLSVGTNNISASVSYAAEGISGDKKLVIYRLANNSSPMVNQTIPADAATGVANTTEISVKFDERMDTATINSATFTVQDQNMITVNGTIRTSYDDFYDYTSATFTPDFPLAFGAIHSVTITSDVKDIAGNHMQSDYQWSFSTWANI